MGKRRRTKEAVVSEPKFTVKASSLTAQTSLILERKVATAPIVYYSEIAWVKMRKAIAMCPKEVGWLGLVEEDVENHTYMITDIFVPKQTVSGAETDIDAEDLALLAASLDEPEKLCYWGHSHVNMGVGPSGQDEEQTAEYLEHLDFFIRGIYNKKGDAKVDVFDMRTAVQYQAVKNHLHLSPMSSEELKAFEATVEENVKEWRATPNPNTQQGGRYRAGTSANLPATRRNPFIIYTPGGTQSG